MADTLPPDTPNIPDSYDTTLWPWAVPRAERWQPPLPGWKWAVPLFVATLITTTVIGARLEYNFALHQRSYATPDDLFPFAWAWRHLGVVPRGLEFSLALIAILLAHELGHFLACRYYRIDATYPLFLPAPTLIGTLGAFIRIRSPFATRREVFDVGIAGPLAGMAVTIPILLWGLAGSRVLTPVDARLWQQQYFAFGWPPLAVWLLHWVHPGAPVAAIAWSPVARAGWIGLLLTMLNLLPGAQLDGGHVLYAVAPRAHTVVSWATMLALVACGWFGWPGWYVFAAFIALMRVRHPRVAAGEPLGTVRIGLALLALGIFATTFMLSPLLTG